ncbi:MAG: hypothetical protein RSG79_08535 [Pseudomonas sp.]
MSSIDLENPHHHLIQRQLPPLGQHASVEQWQALHDTLGPAQGLPDAHPAWFANAAPDLREAVLTSQARLAHSQQALARLLKGLKNITEFAEPLLAQQLTSEHQLSIPLRNTELIHIHHLFIFETYVSQHERRSLLEAALHNFEDEVEFSRESALALSGDVQIEKTAVVGKTSLGDSETQVDIELESETYEIMPLRLAPAEFARTCRTLDLGQRYQQHLDLLFAPAQVATLATQVDQDRLRLAADLAFLRQHMNGGALDQLRALLDAGTPLASNQLSLFGIDLHEALILDLDEAGLLLYLPGQATALQQFHDLSALHDQLRDDLLQVDFRQHFLGYVPRDQQGTFLSRLQQNLDADGDSPNEQTWPLRNNADLHLAPVAIEGELFSFLYQDHVTRLKTEARQLAVPTAEVDEQARKRRLAAWESIGLNTLMMAGFFVPGVGTLMTAVVAYQLLDEVYEGYQAWSVGDRHLALHHLEVVGLNLALIGGLQVAAQVVPKLFNSPLMESLDPVTLEDGSQRLWQPDLTPYRSPVQLPEGLDANAMGQYLHQDRYFIRMQGELYEQRFDADNQQWRIAHPDRPQAWQPPLEHNGEGAWWCQHEQPQLWDQTTLIRRLNESFNQFSDQDLLLAAKINAISETRLRQVYLSGKPTPAQLYSTLERLAGVGKPLTGDGNAALVRALEGLHFPALNSADSDRLLFACLDRLPGWSPKVRLELRGGSPQGPLLASAGTEEAAQRCLVIKSSEGYEAYLNERPAPALRDHDLSRAVLEALPAVRRQALVADTGSEGLRQQVQALADRSRPDLTRRLWGYKPTAWRQSGRLRGGTDQPFAFPAISPLRTSLSARYRRLYPAASDEEIETTLARWRHNLRAPEVELRVLESRLQELRRDLATWAQGSTPRQRAIQPIINAWRRNALFPLANGERIQRLDLADLELEDHDLVSLMLPDGFRHIIDLDLSGNRQLSQLPFDLLSRLPDLRRVRLGECRFSRVPQLFNARALEWLDLQNNRITWDAWAQVTLEHMPNLRVLDLSENPMLQAPDLSRMHNLSSLFLNNASLTHLPIGLQSISEPVSIDLSDNQFITLPDNFAVPAHLGQAMSLESDWLSPLMRLQIDAYYDAHGIDLLVADSDYEELRHESDIHQQQIWNRLPLQYRRDLRQVLELDTYLHDPQQSLADLWQRLALMDVNPGFREQALARPASELLDLMP